MKRINRGLFVFLGIAILIVVAIIAESANIYNQKKQVINKIGEFMEARADYIILPENMRNDAVSEDEIANYIAEYKNSVKDMFCKDATIGGESAIDIETRLMTNIVNSQINNTAFIDTFRFDEEKTSNSGSITFLNNCTEVRISITFDMEYNNKPISNYATMMLIKENNEWKILYIDIDNTISVAIS